MIRVELNLKKRILSVLRDRYKGIEKTYKSTIVERFNFCAWLLHVV